MFWKIRQNPGFEDGKKIQKSFEQVTTESMCILVSSFISGTPCIQEHNFFYNIAFERLRQNSYNTTEYVWNIIINIADPAHSL